LDYKNISLLKKKHLYYKYLQYWDGVINKLKPDVIIMRSVPHAAYNFVIYCLAKKYNIKTIMFEGTVFKDYIMVVEDYKKAPVELHNIYQKIKEENYSPSELGPEKEEYYKKLIDLKYDATPQAKTQIINKMNEPLKIIPSFNKIIKNIKSGNLIAASRYHLKSIFNKTKTPIFTIDENDKEDYRNIYHLRRIKKITDMYKKEYKEFEKDVNFDKKYLYFPMHYQPECNTSPMADYFVDQILLIKTLSAALPPDWLIYIKEHIVQWNIHNAQAHLFRYQGYYKEIANLKNACLLAPEVSSYDLIAHAQAVATATGTAGWEAIARNKPALIFGYPWYMYCDGVFQVKDVLTCKKAIEKIQAGFTPDAQKVLNYLIALDKITIKANIMPYHQKNSTLSMEESVQNITKLICERIYKEE
ncbi:MAG: hypothetical protein ABH830_02710, partial [Patescibacteria group bacterium]